MIYIHNRLWIEIYYLTQFASHRWSSYLWKFLVSHPFSFSSSLNINYTYFFTTFFLPFKLFFLDPLFTVLLLCFIFYRLFIVSLENAFFVGGYISLRFIFLILFLEILDVSWLEFRDFFKIVHFSENDCNISDCFSLTFKELAISAIILNGYFLIESSEIYLS